ncbi:hypothetical protein ILUMI_05997 [Ignelater luminosus]|uniref:Uncharacterized protein n=1 Tax=Ignelater luminosus TaxID=2038154 RepID=A0A8K0DC10_IGNLU|nr:hypothetical protein ILUMI_05997 [Ignelater luminosus]
MSSARLPEYSRGTFSTNSSYRLQDLPLLHRITKVTQNYHQRPCLVLHVEPARSIDRNFAFLFQQYLNI